MEWLGIELHPETPPQGMPIKDMFPTADLKSMMKHLRSMGAPYGIIFSDIGRISNSRLALQAAEFSRDQGRFEVFHDALLQAYFSQGMDIGDRDVVLELAGDAGLEREPLAKALDAGAYLSRLQEMQTEASLAGVTGVPTFILGGRKTIVGAQPIDVFRNTLRSLQ